MADKNDVQGLLGVSMDKIKQMVDVNTIIGEPITVPGADGAPGTVLIPVSKAAPTGPPSRVPPSSAAAAVRASTSRPLPLSSSGRMRSVCSM